MPGYESQTPPGTKRQCGLHAGFAQRPPITTLACCRLLRTLPLRSGVYRIAQRLKKWVPQGQDLIARLANGDEIEIDPSDIDGRLLLLFGTPDPKIVEVCQALCRPGEFLLDIGANLGGVGFLARQAVGQRGRVLMFEPNPQLCQRLRKCINKQGIANVDVHSVALLDRDGTMDLAVSPRQTGAGRLDLQGTGRASDQKVRVSAKNIATYLPALIGDRPFGAKVDVEGAEPYLLPWLLKQRHMRFVVFEYKNTHNWMELWDLAGDTDLTTFGIEKRLFTTRLRVVRNADEAERFHDLVIVRAGEEISINCSVSLDEIRRKMSRHNEH